MTNTEFLAGLKGEQLAFAENLLSQRDDTIARINKATADLTKAQKDAADSLKKATDEHTATVAKLNEEHKAQVDGMNVQMRQLVDSHSTALKELENKLADAESMVTLLGGTEVGKQMAAEKELQEKLAKKAELELQLAELSKQLGSDVIVLPSPALEVK